MSKKNLLVITDGFPDIHNNRYNCNFVYEYINLVKDEFKEIYVISPQPYFPNFASKIGGLKKFGRLANFNNYEIANIKIFYPKFPTLPFSYFRERNHLGFYNQIDSIITSNNLSFDLVHAHFIYPSGLAAIKIKNKYHKKLILTPHGGDIYYWPFKNNKNNEIAKLVLNDSDKITSMSSVISSSIEKVFPPAKKKIVNITNFIDEKKFKLLDKNLCRKKLSIPLNTKIILNVSNLTDGKGHNDLLNAISRLKDKKDCLLYIIGQGELESAIKEQIAELGIEDRIIMVGPIQNHELPYWYNAADVFVFPSYYESFGIVQIEAMACGIPVIAYDNEASKNIINDKHLGALVPIGDKEKLSIALTKTFETNWDREILRQYVVNNFSSQAVRTKLLQTYEELTSEF